MAKRGATEQITKDTWERDEDDGGRDRSEEPAEVASQAVLAKRKILKPRSRVGGASATAPTTTPASTGLFNFGQPAVSSTPTTSLFGQQAQTTTATTPSKNIFGQLAPLSSTTASNQAGNQFGATTQSQSQPQKPLFSNLFGAPAPSSDATPTPSETAAVKPAVVGSTAQPASNLFGSLTPQPATTTTPKPSTFLFGTPPAQVAKPGPSIFSAPTQASNSNGTTAESQKNLFGFPAPKPQDSAGANPPSNTTTPTATPAKPSLFNIFGDNTASALSTRADTQPKPLFGTQSQSSVSTFQPKEKDGNERPPSFGAGNGLFAPNGSQTSSTSLFSIPKPAETQPAPTSAVASNLFGAPATTTTGPSQVKKISEDFGKEKHNPRSLTPPPGVGVAKQDMPHFNWLYQVKSLNVEFQERVEEALSKDAFSDLSGWIDFYHARLAHFQSVKLSQQNQLRGEADTEADSQTDDHGDQMDVTPSKASKLFESALAPLANKPQNASIQNDKSLAGDSNPFAGSVFQPKPSTGLFNQPPPTAGTSNPPAESIFSGASTKPSALFGAAPTSNNEPKTSAPFQFGFQTKTPANIFDSNISKEPDNAALKPFAPNTFSWNSKPNSAVASNASSPGSVLAGGTAGMKDADAGGWSNPFTQENPLFLPGGDDDDDDDGEEGEGEGEGEGDAEGENDDDEDNEAEENAPEPSTATKSEPTSIFAAQPSSSNSLFGRVTSAPTFNFGQTTAPKTGSVGLFGSTTATSGGQTWTPDKGIKFGDRTDSKSGIAPSSAPTTSLFGLQNQAPAPGGLFGTNSAIPTFNFGQPANGTSIFSNPPSKPATPSVLFGGPTSGGLVPPATTFGGPSPAPSDISTPGETSNKEGGEDDNEPSDEAGQLGSNTKDLSGKGPGEEDENEVFETRSSIYNLNNGSYVKIGIGRLRVLKNRINGRARIVVKVETGKILMNVGLRKELDYTKVSEAEVGGKVVKIIEFLPEGKSRVWVMKVGTVDLAQKLRRTLEENK